MYKQRASKQQLFHYDGLQLRHWLARNARRFVFRIIAHVLTLQEHVNLAERRPEQLVSVPALAHKIVDLFRTQTRTRQEYLLTVVAIVVSTVLDDVIIRQAVERLLACERKYLPQRHRERPDVGSRREFALE